MKPDLQPIVLHGANFQWITGVNAKAGFIAGNGIILTRQGRFGPARPPQHGLTLVELILFIAIISIAATSILLVMNRISEHSSDALMHKQSLAIAESLLEEIELQNFSDPVSGITPSPPGNPAQRASFDDITDYNGFATAGIFAIDGTPVAGLGGYSVSAMVEAAALGNIPSASAARITITVADPAGQTIQAIGYRVAY